MPSTCPRCHEMVAEDVVCCAGLAYTWKCKQCHKVCSGFAIPYGKCYLCGGNLEVIEGRTFDDPLKVKPIREAVQFELDSYHFYRLALTRTDEPTLKEILNQLYQHEVEHLHLLQDRYHTHLSADALELGPVAADLLGKALFAGVDLNEPHLGPLALYDRAIAMEKRARDHFFNLAETLPPGPERDVCLELAAEEEEHVTMLETEREQFNDQV